MSIVLLKIWQSENKSIYYELSKKYNVPVKHVYKLVHGKKVKLKMNSYLVLLELRNRMDGYYNIILVPAVLPG